MTYFWNGVLFGLGVFVVVAIAWLLWQFKKAIERNFCPSDLYQGEWTQSVIRAEVKQDRWKPWRADWWKPYHRRSWWD